MVINYLGGGPGLSTTYHLGSATPTLVEAQAAADRVRASWDVVKSILPPSVSITAQGAVDVLDETNGDLAATFGVVVPATVTGTAGTTTGPPQVQAGLILNTSTVVDNHRLRGRLNIGPISSGNTNSPVPGAGVNTAVAAMGVALVTVSPPAATAPVAVWHRPVVSDTGTVTRTGSAFAVTSSQAAAKWFTLRSRLN
jgi:hypothetical protein